MFAMGFANQIDIATLGGGSWNASYPLTNLQSSYLTQKARSTNALTTSTVINLDVITPQRIGVIALIQHNLSALATVRILGSADSAHTSPLYDSGATLVYDHTDYAISFPITEARHWRISIVDTGNSAGYVEIGRIFLGWKFQPSVNIEWEPSLEVESKTGVQEALAGPEYFDERPNRRVWRGALSWLSDAEAYRLLHRIQRTQDVSREVYFMEDDTDTDYRDIRWFLGRFRTLDAITWPYLDKHSMGLEIGEVI